MSALPTSQSSPPLFGGGEIRELRNAVAPTSEGRVVRLSPAAMAVEQKVLAVLFQAPDGRSWRAIGGGDSLAAAIAFARDSLPRERTWHLVGWDDLYSD
jgi:hypothetical protein